MLSHSAANVLIIPALNEAQSIGPTLDRVPAELFSRVIVADNGSIDRTAEIAESHGATVVTEPLRGYGAACLKAIAAMRGDEDVIVFLQADLSEDPAEAERLIEPIRRGTADLVIGSRVLGGAEPGALEPHQRLGNRLVTFLVRLIYGHRYTDIGPFRAISREAYNRLGMRDRNYGWTIEMQIRALQAGLRVKEVPVSYFRRVGQSKVSGTIRGSAMAAWKILWLVFRLAFTAPAPVTRSQPGRVTGE